MKTKIEKTFVIYELTEEGRLIKPDCLESEPHYESTHYVDQYHNSRKSAIEALQEIPSTYALGVDFIILETLRIRPRLLLRKK